MAGRLLSKPYLETETRDWVYPDSFQEDVVNAGELPPENLKQAAIPTESLAQASVPVTDPLTCSKGSPPKRVVVADNDPNDPNELPNQQHVHHLPLYLPMEPWLSLEATTATPDPKF